MSILQCKPVEGAFCVDDIWQPGKTLPAGKQLYAIAERCFSCWGIDTFPSKFRITYNPRLKTTAGRAFLDDRRVELNTRLLSKHPKQLVPTLAHELAHVVTHMRSGVAAPHGREFRELMRTVGLSSKATHSMPTKGLRRKRRKFLYLHRCSDCSCSFIARRVRRDCYCRDCGPDMSWTIFRAPNTAKGRGLLETSRQG